MDIPLVLVQKCASPKCEAMIRVPFRILDPQTKLARPEYYSLKSGDFEIGPFGMLLCTSGRCSFLAAVHQASKSTSKT
jgi:hypothetical protein